MNGKLKYKKALNRQVSLALVFILVLVNTVATSQDLHFSQFTLSPLNLNASFTGLSNADFRFSLQHRQQWKSVTVPYKTFSVAFDMQAFHLKNYKKQISFGLVLNNDNAGDGNLTSTSGAVTMASSFILNDSATQISAGIQAGAVNRSVNFQKLYFDEQYDGDVFNPSLPNNEIFANDNKTMPDAGAGISIRHFSEAFEIVFGISANHINQPSISFYDDNAVKLPVHYTAVAYSTIALNEAINLMPSLLYMRQNSLSELTVGAGLQFKLNEKEKLIRSFDAGLNYRNKDAVFINLGADFNNFHAGFSYDINVSSLNRASNYKGAVEAALVYKIYRVKNLNPSVPCIVY